MKFQLILVSDKCCLKVGKVFSIALILLNSYSQSEKEFNNIKIIHRLIYAFR